LGGNGNSQNMLQSRRFHLLLSLALALAAASCANEPFDPESWQNVPPTASIWVLPAQPDTLKPTTYNQASFHWAGTDVDGFVVGYHVSIAPVGEPPVDWIFTTSEETTATYRTDANGRAFPTLYVVAQDDRGALSDTVSVTFPLVNFPPVLEFGDGFVPARQTFSAASFDFFGFDLDGDETLLPWVEYRFAGSDPDSVFDLGDSLADPSVGWVRVAKNPTHFSMVLRNIPPGDPASDHLQTLYVRILDEAGGVSTLQHSWQVFPVVGDVLLVDDAPTTASLASRDSFYRDALEILLPGAHSVWDISDGMPDRESDIRLTLEPFRVLIWYTGSAESANLLRAQSILTDFITGDLDPTTPGTQSGRLILETSNAVGAASNLGSGFRSNILGLEKNSDPRSSFRITSNDLRALGDTLDVEPQLPGLPVLGSAGQNYLGGAGFFFSLYGFILRPQAAELYRFESYDYLHDRRPTTPILASRRPDTGLAEVIVLGFPLEFANARGDAVQALGILLRDHLGHSVTLPVGAQP